MRLFLFFTNIKVIFEFLIRKILRKMHGRKLNFSMLKFNNFDKSINEKIDELNLKGYTILRNFIDLNRVSYIRSKSYSLIDNETIIADNKSYIIELTKCQNSKELLDICYNLKMNNFIRCIAYNYLGLGYFPRYSEIWYTPKTNINKDYQGSQLWHLDHESKKQLKVFILISSNLSKNSMTEFISKEKTKKILPFIKSLLYKNKHIDNNNLDSLAENENLCSGDLLMLDTSKCFHRGGRITDFDRLIYSAQYIPFSSKVSHFFRK